MEADLEIRQFMGDEYLVHCEDIRCGGESLDDEEMGHLMATNPGLPVHLAQLALIKEKLVTAH